MRPFHFAIVAVVCSASALAATPPPAGSTAAQPVSPGADFEVAPVDARCPTFSWSAAAGAAGYELVVYPAGDAGSRPVLRQVIAGAALSWTPDADRCLEPGRLYGWAVRPTGGAWSTVRLFRVADPPSRAEVAEALAVLRRFLAAEGESPDAPQKAGAREPHAANPDLGAPVARVSDPGARSGESGTPDRAADPPPLLVAAPAALAAGAYSLSVSGDVDLGGQVFRNGVPFLHDHGGPNRANTALGRLALSSVDPRTDDVRSYGSSNTAVGSSALRLNADGNANTAVGARAMWSANSAGGEYADRNVAVGWNAMESFEGGEGNVAVGPGALGFAASGSFNVALGSNALIQAVGERNIGLGRSAGSQLETGSDNVYIGHPGAVSETGVVRLGDPAVHTLTSLAGDVGIGTETPGTRLHVVGEIDGSATLNNHVVRIQNAAPTTGNGPDVLALQTSATSPTAKTNFVTFYNGSGGAVGTIQGNGAGGVTYATSGADFAEMLPKLDPAEVLTPGDVVGLHGDRVSRATRGADGLLVVTTAPLLLGAHPGDDADLEAFAPIALLGQVPVRVRGAVAVGDVLVASGVEDGIARAVRPQALATADLPQVVGTALDAHGEGGPGRVRALVGVLPAAPLARTLARRQDDLDRRLRRLEAGAGGAGHR